MNFGHCPFLSYPPAPAERREQWRNFFIFQPILIKLCMVTHFTHRKWWHKYEMSVTNFGQQPYWGRWPVEPPYIWHIWIFHNFAKRPIKISWPFFLLFQTSYMSLVKRINHLSLFQNRTFYPLASPPLAEINLHKYLSIRDSRYVSDSFW